MDVLRERFPDRIQAIEALRRRDPRFAEICSDYEEVSAWLAERCRSEDTASPPCETAREALRELAVEIARALENDAARSSATRPPRP